MGVDTSRASSRGGRTSGAVVGDIAIIGMGCRFPGANTPAEFWQNQVEQRDCVSIVPPDRWDWRRFHDDDPERVGKLYFNRGGYLENIDQFDAEFFGIAPAEANYLDPQQRLLLEVIWETLENAQVVPASLKGSDLGVFIGISALDYATMTAQRTPLDKVSPYCATGSALSPAAGRIAYFLGTHGPAMSIDTACSSSLVALHTAIRSLRAGESAAALVAGVNVLLAIEPSMNFARAHMLAADGRCKTFSDQADGYVRGEGCGAVLLKPLQAAEQAGDRILAVIRGSAVNQDGASAGLTAPYGPAQTDVIEKALDDAGALPDDVSYVEAHGTGTALGDPIELKALSSVFHTDTRPAPLPVGSIKTQIGHLEPAAGMASLIRVVLSMQAATLPAHLWAERPTTRIDWNQSGLRVMGSPEQWQADGPRVAGISGFGFSGTNAHVVLQEYKGSQETSPIERPQEMDALAPPELFCLSARDPAALVAMGRAYLSLLQDETALNLAELAYASVASRADFLARVWWSASTEDAVIENLHRLANADVASLDAAGINYARARQITEPVIAFMFSGQGSQWAGMGRGLYASNRLFKKVFDRCDAIFAEERGGESLTSLVFQEENEELLMATANTQPAIYAFESAYAACLSDAGLRPTIVLGHSIGEYVAAQVAGVFSLEDGMRLVCRRGSLMQTLPSGGGLLAVFDSEAGTRQKIDEYGFELDIAAINAPTQIVVSGSQFQLEALAERLDEVGVVTRPLRVSHAFHSRLMDPMLERFRSVCDSIQYHQPSCELISNVTGDRAGTDIATAQYWVDHVRAPVQFSQSVRALANAYCDVVLEVGPQATLSASAKLSLAEDLGEDEIPAIQPCSRQGQNSAEAFKSTLGACYSMGVLPDWNAESLQWRDALPGRFAYELPNYPFQRQSFWFAERQPRERWEDEDRVASSAAGSLCKGLLGRTVPLAVDVGDCQVFQASISAQSPEYLSDHQVFSEVVLPAAGYLDMLVTAACYRSGAGPDSTLVLRDIVIRRPVILGEHAVSLQTVRRDDAIKIHVLDDESDQWSLVASARFDIVQVAPAPMNIDERLDDTIDVDAFYAAMRERGLEYGPAFQTVTAISVCGEGQVLGVSAELERQSLLPDSNSGVLDPTLLDGAFQTAAALLIDADEAVKHPDRVYLPVAIDQVVVPLEITEACDKACVALRIVEQKPAFSCVNLSMQYQGLAPVSVEGLRLFAASRDSLLAGHGERAQSADNAFGLEWLACEPPTNASAAVGSWLLLHWDWKEAEQWQTQLEQRGCSSSGLSLGAYEAQSAQALMSILAEAVGAIAVLRGVLIVPPKLSVEELSADMLRPGFELLRALASLPGALPERLVLLRPSEMGAASREQAELVGAALEAMGGVFANESGCSFAHVEYTHNTVTLDALACELASELPDKHIRLIGADREVLRLRPVEAINAQGTLAHMAGAGAYRLMLKDYGSFEQLALEPVVSRLPADNEVTVRIDAAALNFKDLLLALGSLTEYLEGLGYEKASEVPLGFEAAGEVTAIGANVKDIEAGQKVVVTQTGCMASTMTVERNCVAALPRGLNCVQGAALPTVFMTALYALEQLAQLQAGERVLIHAAAGGVGQAALQVARSRGAIVYATAAPSKWDMLRAQGVENLYSSRDIAFSAAIMADTGGEGVDVVLNALNGEFIAAGIDALADDGRFIEIGKVGVWTADQVYQRRPDVAYHLFDLADVTVANPDIYMSLQQSLWERFDEGTFSALPVEVFDVQEAERAMRHMSQARHIGKVVLRFPAVYEGSPIRSDRSYLITGATGGIGQALVEWLVGQGAEHLLLVSRGEGPELLSLIEKLRVEGVAVNWMGGDIADAAHVSRCVDAATKMAPLGGVFHAAGTTADALLRDKDWSGVRAVMAGKADGAWHLHRATEAIDELEHFVVFSSVSAVYATPGQGDYAAANAVLDRLVEQRWQAGLPALSINWGPWAGHGMAAGMEDMFSRLGVQPLKPARAFAILKRALVAPPRRGRLLATETRWETFIRLNDDSLFELLADAAGPSGEHIEGTIRGELKAELGQLGLPQRRRALQLSLQKQLASTLGLPGDQLLDPAASFFDLGLDSLMGMELKGRLERALDVRLQPTVLIEAGNLQELADTLLVELAPEFSEQEEAVQTQLQTDSVEASLQETALAELGGDELEALLEASLDDIDEVLS